MFSLVQCVKHLGGVASPRHLKRFGFDRHALLQAATDGHVLRIRQGVYVHPDVPVDARHAIAHGGLLACSSAARSYGIWVPPESRVHISMDPKRHEFSHGPCECVVHWNVRSINGWRVSVQTALEQLYACLGEDYFFAAYESAMHTGLISADARLRLPRSVHALKELALRDVESGIESLARLRLRRSGITCEVQVRILGVGRVDLLIDGWLIIELDGRENHAGQDLRHKDLQRDARAAALGYFTLRFDYSQVVHSWDEVENAVIQTLASRVA